MLLEEAMELARKLKRMHESDSMPIHTLVHREGRHLATVMFPTTDREPAEWAIGVCASGFGAEAVTLIMDAQMGKGSLDNTRRQLDQFMETYTPGDMQRLIDSGQSSQLFDEVAEVLIVTHGERVDGDVMITTAMLQYVVDAQGIHPIVWRKPMVIRQTDTDAELSGFWTDVLRSAMNMPDKLTEVQEEMPETADDPDARQKMDHAVGQMLADVGCGMMLFEEESS